MPRRKAQPGATQVQKRRAATPSAAPAEEHRVLSAADRENPDKLTGEPLRKLAHSRGMAKSDLERMSDEKIREQMRYIAHRQYEEA